MLPDFRRSNSAVGRSPALQQISGTGGKNVTGYIPNARAIRCTIVTCSLQILYVLVWDRTQAAAVRGRLLTTRAMAGVIKPCISSKFSCYHTHKKGVLYNGYRDSFPGVERVGPELGHSPSSSVKVENERVHHLTPVRLRGTDRDTLTCYL
jgi:hypothetical protein